MNPYVITDAGSSVVPIVISVPHCGTYFPEELRDQYKDHLLQGLDDTDWFVHKLYDFAPAMGITMIHATYHRWVVDLNRDPNKKPLYSDNRLITGLAPVTAFTGEALYKDERTDIDESDIEQRVEKYFNPYHGALQEILKERLDKFGKVLLWDCHSIRQSVPTIHPKEFPDLILGDNDGFAAEAFLTEMATKSLRTGSYSFENNFLFKGGYITRHYGKPKEHQHALQLEVTKVNYMDDEQRKYDATRAGRMRDHLQRTFEKLITILNF